MMIGKAKVPSTLNLNRKSRPGTQTHAKTNVRNILANSFDKSMNDYGGLSPLESAIDPASRGQSGRQSLDLSKKQTQMRSNQKFIKMKQRSMANGTNHQNALSEVQFSPHKAEIT